MGATLLIISHFFKGKMSFLRFIEGGTLTIPGGTTQNSSWVEVFLATESTLALSAPSSRIWPLPCVYHLLSCSWRQMEESEDSRIQLNHEL